MAFIPLSNGIRVAVEYLLAGKQVANIFHVTSDSPVDGATLTSVAEEIVAWWNDTHRAEFSDDIALTSVVATDISEENGGQHIEVPVSPIPGTDLAPSWANNVALVTSFRTDKTGRSFRGRAYNTGIARTAVTDNEVLLTKATNIGINYVQLISDLTLLGINFVVASFIKDGSPRLAAVATIVETIIVNRRVDTQRRRLPADTS